MAETFNVKGEGPISIRRGEGGVPSIEVEREADLYRGLGYMHAWDRGVQLLMVRILGQGRACELLNGDDATLEVDRFFRRLNLCCGIKDEVERLSQDHTSLLEAYCDGINQALDRRKPWELRLLGVKQIPAWTPSDCVMMTRIIGYVSLAQSQGDMERMIMEMVQGGVEEPYLEALFPDKLGGMDMEAIKKAELGARVVPDAIRWQCALPRVMASNNWVVAGSRSRSGQPVLCNDPHLEVNRLPAVWYEAVGRQGDRTVISATMPGIPGFIVGRSKDLAWGATYAFMDAEDSWIEDCREGKYRREVDGEDVWTPFEVRTETVARKKGRPEEMVFYENDHGTLSGDPNLEGFYVSTRWAPARSGARSFETIFELWRADTVERAMALLGQLEVAFNWVLADSAGNIGYQMSGVCPRRRSGVSGLVPLPGWDAANDWQGFLDAAELPRQLNPECGYIATANDDLNHLGRARVITLDMGSYRADRIRALLAQRSDHDTATMGAMMMDVVSEQARTFMEILGPVLPETPQGALLGAWDCRYDLDSEGAWLFEQVYEALLEEVFSSAWGLSAHTHLSGETNVFIDFYCHFDRVLLQETSVWFRGRSRQEIFAAAAKRALDVEPRPWRQGRSLMMGHIIFGGKLPRLLGFDHGPIDLPGGRATILQGQIYNDAGRQTSFAPSYRIITDFKENSAQTNLAGGVSDRRFSRLYKSDLQRWIDGAFKELTP